MQDPAAEYVQTAEANVPLVVDLDGSLIRSDLLIESAFAHVGRDPRRAGALLIALLRGKAALKSTIATVTEIDASHLPYDGRVIELIQTAREAKRQVYLASASNERYVRAVVAELGLFDGWFASSATDNLAASAKAARLVEAFGANRFDYIGNDAADIPVWSVARRRIAVQPSKAVEKKLLAIDPNATILKGDGSALRHWAKLLRIHQWAKNALVFVPLVTAQKLDIASFSLALSSFIAFSMIASGIYIVNDLVDIDADRKHRSKKNRPLAAGTVSVLDAMIVAPILATTATVAAFLINRWFGATLLCYLALTTAYTFVLKRKMMVDVVTLAMLYTLRVVGGAAVIAVPVSEWLLAFSMFMFLALALIKRYTELAGRLDANLPDPTNRDYLKLDLDIVAALAAASGFNAVTVFTLYISSDTVRQLYSRPLLLWLICPILMHWVGRIIMLAHRRVIDDDPVLFAIKDRTCILAVAMIGAILVAAK